MAQQKPGFITGANAKIKAFNKTLAFCSDVAYNVTVQTIPIESMGKYEVHSNEPVGYTVDGSFSIIRYTKNATDSTKGGEIGDAASGKSNAPENITDSGAGNMQEHIDPARLLQSQTFDLEIHEKRAGGSDTEVITVADCRLTRRGMSLNKRGVMVDNYAFVGILATDKDTTEVGNSGSGDLD
jgi:hypothetical protein